MSLDFPHGYFNKNCFPAESCKCMAAEKCGGQVGMHTRASPSDLSSAFERKVLWAVQTALLS